MNFRSLRTRIVVFFGLLLMLVLGVVFAVVMRENFQIARQQNHEELEVGERVFKRLLTQNQTKLTQAAVVLAADFGFREAVSSNELATVLSALKNHGHRIHADAIMLIGLDRKLIADTLHPQWSGRAAPIPGLLDAAEMEGNAAGIVLIDLVAYQMVVVPVLAPDPIAWVILGFVIDDRLAHELQSLTSVQVSFLAQARYGDWSTLASTQPITLRKQLPLALVRQAGDYAPSLVIGEYESLVVPLMESNTEVIVAVLQRSIPEAVARFDPLLRTLLVLFGASLAIALVGSVGIARNITNPINKLAAVAQRIQNGDYAEAVDVDATGEIGALAGTFNHMRGAIASRETEIRRLAYEDSLTGLPNRSMIMERLDHLVSLGTSTGRSFAVLLLDLDRFREINDTLGHEAGDQVLEIVAQRLRHIATNTDMVARLGGDEFALLLASGDPDWGEVVVRRIHRALDEPLVVAQQSVDVSASIGMVCFPEHGHDAGTLLRRSDIAMYAAKRARNGFAMYDLTHDEYRQERLHLLGDLRKAANEDELRLLYQPKVELLTRRVCGVEALLRWHHPERGMVAPAEFIPFAEQTGAIRLVTRWVIAAAINQCSLWLGQNNPLEISINISARDLLDPELPEYLHMALDQAQVPARLLCLEITESALMEDPTHAHATVMRLHEMGLALAIDDYGTGYSSLAYMKDLPVNELKIDRTFITDIAILRENAAIVRSTIELGHHLGVRVVAEGIEGEREFELLRKFGCDVGQGYFISRPLEAEALQSWLTTTPRPPGTADNLQTLAVRMGARR